MPRLTMELSSRHKLTRADVEAFNKSRVWYRSEGLKGTLSSLVLTYQTKEDGAATVRWALEVSKNSPKLTIRLHENLRGVLWGIPRIARNGVLYVDDERFSPQFTSPLEEMYFREFLERAKNGEWDDVPESYQTVRVRFDGRAAYGLRVRFPEKTLEQVLVDILNQHVSRVLLGEEISENTRFRGTDFQTLVRIPRELAKKLRDFKDINKLVNDAVADLANLTNW